MAMATYRMSAAAVQITVALLFGLSLPAHARGQDFVRPEETARINRLMDLKARQRNTLKCHIDFAKRAYLGFASRYHTGFRITAKYTEVAPGLNLVAYIRVTPRGDSPVFLGEDFQIPRKRPTATTGSGSLTFMVNLGGSFDVGQGRYQIDLLLMDERGRSFFKRWHLQTVQNGRHAIRSVLGPLQVARLARETWNGRLDRKGLRLTVLFDATAPQAWEAELWNRDLLLDLLVALLRGIPCRSVRIVAFNLDLQRRVFTRDNFDSKGFNELRSALTNLPLSLVPYRTLERDSSLEFLERLMDEESSRPRPPDAVLFVGSHTHFFRKPPKSLTEKVPPIGPRLFYFEYYGFATPFPDTIDYFTRDLHGTVFRINTPNDLGVAIVKMLAQVGQSQRFNAASGSEVR